MICTGNASSWSLFQSCFAKTSESFFLIFHFRLKHISSDSFFLIVHSRLKNIFSHKEPFHKNEIYQNNNCEFFLLK